MLLFTSLFKFPFFQGILAKAQSPLGRKRDTDLELIHNHLPSSKYISDEVLNIQ